MTATSDGLHFFYEPAERGRLCVVRVKAPPYTGTGEVVARGVELELAKRIVPLLNGEHQALTAAYRAGAMDMREKAARHQNERAAYFDGMRANAVDFESMDLAFRYASISSEANASATAIRAIPIEDPLK